MEFDKSGPTPDTHHPVCRGDPYAKAKSAILEPQLDISGPSHKTFPTFNFSQPQKGMPDTAKYTSIIPIVNLGLETITWYSILHFEHTPIQEDGNNQCVIHEGATKEEGIIHETPIEWESNN